MKSTKTLLSTPPPPPPPPLLLLLLPLLGLSPLFRVYTCLRVALGVTLTPTVLLLVRRSLAALRIYWYTWYLVYDTPQGLVGFVNLMRSHPRAVAEHRALVLKCLSDDDVTIRTRALELLSGALLFFCLFFFCFVWVPQLN